MKKYQYYVIRLNELEGIYDDYLDAIYFVKYLKDNGWDYGLKIIKGKVIESE